MRALLWMLVAASSALATSAMAQARGPFFVEETGRSFSRLGDAVASIGDHDGTITISPGTYSDCAIQTAGRIAYHAAQAGTVIFDGRTCEGKAALVLRGRDHVVDGLIFQNMRVPDGNGAGIRLEHGPLTVTNTIFRDSEEGILTADDPAAAIRIDRSTFSGLGRCDRGLSCAHSVYVGGYGNVTVTRSRFEKGRGGHYLKTRSARTEVSDSSFDDSRGHATNYMIDLCAGSTGTITRNMFVQGPDKENHSALITVAAESRANSSAGLKIIDNQASLAPGIPWKSVFVADWSHQPLTIQRNRLGAGIGSFELR